MGKRTFHPFKPPRNGASDPLLIRSLCRSHPLFALLYLLAATPGAAQVLAPRDQETNLTGTVTKLLEAPPLPPVVVDPAHRYLLLVNERALTSIQDLAEPMLEVAGFRVDPQTYGPHAPLDYFGLTLVDLQTDETARIALPRNITVGFPKWSPDGSRFAFTVTRRNGIELWIGEPSERRARKLLGPVLNATTSAPCSWMPDSHHLLCRVVPPNRRSTDPLAMSPYMRRGEQPVLMPGSPPSQGLIAQLLETQLVSIDVVSEARRDIGLPAAFLSVKPAPSGAFLLVSRLTPPYPQFPDSGSPASATEVWDVAGRLVRTLSNEHGNEPVPRARQWHPARPATLVWVERADGHDRVVAQAAPFTDRPNEIFNTNHWFSGITWLEDSSLALLNEYDEQQRVASLWLVGAAGIENAARLLDSHSVDARFSSFGTPITGTTLRGQKVITVHENGIFLHGAEPAAHGTRHFLDYLPFGAKARERLWESSEHGYEPLLDVLNRDGSLLLTEHESAEEPPNYIVHDLAKGMERQITHFAHPAPSLQAARRIPLRYLRDDGYELSSVLYLPPGADPKIPLPLVMWAYPRETGGAADALAGPSPERFLDFKRAFKLFFLLRGYAVMDDVSMPIIGTPGTANDTFIEQVVENTRAALEAAAATGLVDPQRSGVAGHSYGAFMVANLLAHSHLFKAGVAMSGAYNRTLTPFGFQTERRTLWEAPEMYMAMSPLLYSNRIEAPLLLVHGLLDDNAGAQPIQSRQFYEAIRRNGGRAELLLLPFEGHAYRARESVLQTAEAMLDWFDRYLKNTDPSRPLGERGVAQSDD